MNILNTLNTRLIFVFTRIFAEGEGEQQGDFFDHTAADLEELYGKFKKVVTPLAVIACVLFGINLLLNWDDQQAFRKSRNAIVTILIALGIIYGAEVLVSTISGLFQ